MDVDEGTESPGVPGWQVAAIFVVVTFVLAILLAVYVLAWDGGAHT